MPVKKRHPFVGGPGGIVVEGPRGCMTGEEEIRGLLQSITSSIVDDATAIRITDLHSERAFIFELEVGPADVGKVIGRGGKTAGAIRTLLEAAAGKWKKRLILEILDRAKP